MDKPIVSIELGSKKLKLVVGYEYNGQVYVVYTLLKNYGHIIENGNILDFPKLVNCITSASVLSDPSAQLQLSVKDCLLSLSPEQLDIFTAKQVTTVISEEGKISPIDVRNLYSLIKNSDNKTNKIIVDIIPESFIMDNSRVSLAPPIGDIGHTLGLNCKVHLMPENVYKNVLSVFKEAKIEVKRTVSAPLAIAELFATYPEVPENYILVDIGSDTTSVSLIGKKSLFKSKIFQWGGDMITDKIVSSFNINEADAEKYKIVYGIDNKTMNFKAPICSTTNLEGAEIKHYTNELNEIIKSELDSFAKLLNESIKDLLYKQSSNLAKLPMVLTGGGSQLHGLIDYLNPKVESDSIIKVAPKTLGARNPTFASCLGTILVSSKYLSLSEETHLRVGTVSREE